MRTQISTLRFSDELLSVVKKDFFKNALVYGNSKQPYSVTRTPKFHSVTFIDAQKDIQGEIPKFKELTAFWGTHSQIHCNGIGIVTKNGHQPSRRKCFILAQAKVRESFTVEEIP